MTATNGNGTTENAEQLAKIEELIGNTLWMRNDFLSRFSSQHRDINQECDWPDMVSVQQYRELFDSNPIAHRVCELLPAESWQITPNIYEDESSKNATEFENAWDDLGKDLLGLGSGKSWYQDEEGSPIWTYLQRADILSGIGSFGVILIGIDDGKLLDQPADGVGPDGQAKDITGIAGLGTVSKDIYGTTRQQTLFGSLGTDEQYYRTQFSPAMPPGSGKGNKRKLTFLRCFDESLVQVVQYEADMRSPRYGQPLTYLITMNDPRQPRTGIGLPLATVRVHWSRVVHVADNLLNSEVFGIPRLRPVVNNILDLRKLYGGSAEMYWRGAFPGLSFETHPQLGGDVIINKAGMRQMIDNYFNGLDRALQLMGMSAKTLAPQVVDPSPQIAVQLEAICIKLGCPIRVFKGSERGELASSQDDASWNDRLRHRQSLYISPRVIAPFVDRLIALKVLPEPDGYSIEWPDLDSLTDKDKAGIALSQTQAMAAYVGGGVEAIMPPQEYLTVTLGLEEEQAKAILAAAASAHEDTMTIPPAGEQGHPGTPPPPPPKFPPMPGKPPGMPPGATGKAPGGQTAGSGSPTPPAVKGQTAQRAAPAQAKPPAANAKMIDTEELAGVAQWLSKNGLMPGYGQTYLNESTGEVWYVGGDGDEDGFGKLVAKKLGAIAGVKKVTYEAEAFPKDDGYVKVFKGTVNAFCATGEGGGVDPSCPPGSSASGSGRGEPDIKVREGAKSKNATNTLQAIAHKAYTETKGGFAAIGKAVYDKLPKPVQELTDVLQHIEHKAEGLHAAGQKLAVAVAKESGLSDANVAQVGRALAAADGASRWTANIPGLHAAIHALELIGGPASFAAAKVGFYVPIASLAFVGYHMAKAAVTGKNPLTVITKARERVKAEGGEHGHKEAKPTPKKLPFEKDEPAKGPASPFKEIKGSSKLAVHAAEDAVENEGWITLEDSGQRVYISGKGDFLPSGPKSAPAAEKQKTAPDEKPSKAAAKIASTAKPVKDAPKGGRLSAKAQAREKFLAAKAKARERMLSKKTGAVEKQDQSSLQPLKDSGVLRVGNSDHPAVKQHLSDLAKIPQHVHAELVGKGMTGVYVDNAPLTGLDHLQSMKGITPRGWPAGKTWDTVAGGYVQNTKSVCAGVGEGGSATGSLLLHEYGHAVGHLLGMDDHPRTIELHKELYPKLWPYLQQGGPGGHAGRQEFVAELFAGTIHDRKATVGRFGEKAVKYMEERLGVKK